MQLDLGAVESLWFVRLIATVPQAYAAVSALHILGIAVTVGAIVPVDLRLAGLIGASMDDALDILSRISSCGFVFAACAGLLLVSVRITEYFQNPFFLAKLGILMLAGSNAAATFILCAGGPLRSIAGQPSARIVGGVSLALWVGAVAAGRWIAFADS